ncbi:MAG: RNA methyltransferase [Myxococcales bacterium]|nr:RNA methyltransferase [Myxococcales bacterium]
MRRDALHVVLCNPADPRNVGGAIRAVANFELGSLRVVTTTGFDPSDLRAFSSESIDTMELRFFETLDEAIGDCTRVIGTSRREHRDDAPPEWPAAGLAARVGDGAPTAILFGAERTGLLLHELDRCQAWVQIPTGDRFPSMNLAHAVACVCYELARPLEATVGPPLEAEAPPKVPAAAREAFFAAIEDCVASVNYPPGRGPEHFVRRLRKVLARANPNAQELALFGGVFAELKRLGGLAGVEREEP